MNRAALGALLTLALGVAVSLFDRAGLIVFAPGFAAAWHLTSSDVGDVVAFFVVNFALWLAVWVLIILLWQFLSKQYILLPTATDDNQQRN